MNKIKRKIDRRPFNGFRTSNISFSKFRRKVKKTQKRQKRDNNPSYKIKRNRLIHDYKKKTTVKENNIRIKPKSIKEYYYSVHLFHAKQMHTFIVFQWDYELKTYDIVDPYGLLHKKRFNNPILLMKELHPMRLKKN